MISSWLFIRVVFNDHLLYQLWDLPRQIAKRVEENNLKFSYKIFLVQGHSKVRRQIAWASGHKKLPSLPNEKTYLFWMAMQRGLFWPCLTSIIYKIIHFFVWPWADHVSLGWNISLFQEQESLLIFSVKY